MPSRLGTGCRSGFRVVEARRRSESASIAASRSLLLIVWKFSAVWIRRAVVGRITVDVWAFETGAVVFVARALCLCVFVLGCGGKRVDEELE